MQAEGRQGNGPNTDLRTLPSVDEVLRSPVGRRLLGRAPRWAVVRAIQAEINELRQGMLERPAPATATPPAATTSAATTSAATTSAATAISAAALPARLSLDEAALEARLAALLGPSLRPVINATGVVLHTNLGRAPLAAEALAEMLRLAGGYCNLEYDLERGKRGSRHRHLGDLIVDLCGGEAALVVNNNAAAVLLALTCLASGREVVISRGELVEIGGSFRIPDVMRQSGARLVEVGTTNKTRLSDYRAALSPSTALLLRVHRSNFALVGFAEDTPLAELAALAHEASVPLMVDLGSGCLLDLPALSRDALPHEPTVQETLRQGAGLVALSGDKLLGGPQAGILVGDAALVGRAAVHPLMRALRPDKLALAALHATLTLYRDGRAPEAIPALRMLLSTTDELEERAARLVRTTRAAVRAAVASDAACDAPGGAASEAASGATSEMANHVPEGGVRPAQRPPPTLELVRVRSRVGGGALPLAELESAAVAVSMPGRSAVAVEAALRAADPAVVGRIADHRLLLDMRTVLDEDLPRLAQALARLAV